MLKDLGVFDQLILRTDSILMMYQRATRHFEDNFHAALLFNDNLVSFT